MTRRARSRRIAAGWTVATLCALALAGCSKGAVTGSAGTEVDTAAKPDTTAGRTPTTRPVKTTPLAKLTGAHISIADGQTVGVGMPMSVTFDHAIPAGERAEVERQLKVDADVEGSWSWVKDRNLLEGQRVDFRPRAYEAPGTAVTVRAGSGITRPFTSQTVGYGDAYAGYYSYAVHLTTSGTYLHQNPNAHTYAGHQNVTHGCVGLATDGTARKFYDEVIPGDVITVVGSKGTVAVGNGYGYGYGYGDWNADWAQWRAGSALK
ncbi:Ig-like domain-containing protein [Streptomyces mirabilis]|uniref:Ig-like domain-containing protein n=1 Tax=Streptomyces mirabilis TaxID=68239 RepID=UPI0036BF0239